MQNTLLKYAGNKRLYMPVIANNFDWTNIDTYVEPFCGAMGAALNCGLEQRDVHIRLSDVNWEVVNLHEHVRDRPSDLSAAVNTLSVDECTYYEVRNWDRDPNWRSRDPLELAVRTLYLNRHCFNGLFRVNRSGQFNVPWNRSLRRVNIDIDTDYGHVASLMRRAQLSCGSYVDVLSTCGRGSLVYCDPPYVDTKVVDRQFSGYVGCFGTDEQVRLRDAAVAAQCRGARVYISNADCEQTRQLYACATRIVDVTGVRRSLSCRSSSRGRVCEIVACFV